MKRESDITRPQPAGAYLPEPPACPADADKLADVVRLLDAALLDQARQAMRLPRGKGRRKLRNGAAQTLIREGQAPGLVNPPAAGR